ncbi:hypothetical protein GCM10009414_33980 [Tatumella terrea]|uniref:rhamnogalacturonan lyase B N-terminal domain-containing protein n=1 Tax=Tatumella terrea TaxID=419007 RepID=UPI0031D1A277
MSEFGLVESTDFYTISNGSNLTFKVRKTDNGSHSQSIGDIASLNYKGVEYQDQSRGSQINSGFDYLYKDTNKVIIDAKVVSDSHIKITVQAGNLTHYYLCQENDDSIYMGTVIDSEPETQAQLRYIVRSLVSKLPDGPTPSDIRNNTGAIESGDIFGLENGETRSKHYSNIRLCDWTHIGATGNDVGLWVVRGNSEGMSGGPFYRCLLNQCGNTDQEVTYMINYGMSQTEGYRFGILNEYALVFTDGSEPGSIDTSWFSGLNLKGWVSPDSRGTVSGTVRAVLKSSYSYRVGLSNSNAQYWTDVDISDNSFMCGNILPGNYTVKLYKNELEILTTTVAITAGNSTTLNLSGSVNDPSDDVALWRIGDWDGTPTGLLNANKVTYMHPSDTRISTWAPGIFSVGESEAEISFPAYQWQDINNSQQIKFTLTEDEVYDYTLRIGITVAYAGARPSIILNEWKGTQSSKTQPDSRSLTVGTYRGNNQSFQFAVPSSALVVGDNTITINVSSGSAGDDWLSPSYAFDAIDFIKSN